MDGRSSPGQALALRQLAARRTPPQVASASGTAAIGEVVCIGVLCDFAFGPLRRLRLEAQSGQRAAFQRQSSAQTFVDGTVWSRQ